MVSPRRIEETSEVPSTAAIAGHPIHPMLIPFPIASFVGALVTDVIYLLTNDDFWSRASMYLVGAGLITGAVAAVVGLIDFATKPRIRQLRIAWIHFGGNALVMVLALISLLRRRDDPSEAVAPIGLLLSIAISTILIVTGWLGGEMSYRHKIGVNSAKSDTLPGA